jgi:hypothetical protein
MFLFVAMRNVQAAPRIGHPGRSLWSNVVARNPPLSMLAGMTEGEKYKSPQQIAALLNCHPKTVIRACKSGRLPSLNLGGAGHDEFRIDPADLAALRHSPSASVPKTASRGRRRGACNLPPLRIG